MNAFSVADPAGEDGIAAIEERLDYPIPPEFRSTVASISASVDFRWAGDDPLELAALSVVIWGRLTWDLESLPELRSLSLDTAKHMSSDWPSRSFWSTSLPFCQENADFFALDLRKDSYGEVIYLGIRDELVGSRVAIGFVDFMNRFSALGFPAPTPSSWRPFYDASARVVNPESAAARVWREAWSI